MENEEKKFEVELVDEYGETYKLVCLGDCIHHYEDGCSVMNDEPCISEDNCIMFVKR